MKPMSKAKVKMQEKKMVSICVRSFKLEKFNASLSCQISFTLFLPLYFTTITINETTLDMNLKILPNISMMINSRTFSKVMSNIFRLFYANYGFISPVRGEILVINLGMTHFIAPLGVKFL